MGYDEPWAEALDAEQGPLEQVAPGVWWAWSLMRSPPLPRNMVVVRLPDGLLVHSCVCLREPEMDRLDSLGKVRWLLVPNEGHRSDIKRFKRRYPDARVIAPRAAVPKVEEVHRVDASCEDELPGVGIVCHSPDGMKDGYELVYEVPLEGGGKALLVNDILGSTHPHAVGGFKGMLMGFLGPPGGQLGQARIVRQFFAKDRKAFRGFVERLAALPDLRLMTTSHGPPVAGDVSGALREAATRL